jgi:hypothetical protein
MRSECVGVSNGRSMRQGWFAMAKAGISKLAYQLQRMRHRVTPSSGTIAAGFSS